MIKNKNILPMLLGITLLIHCKSYGSTDTTTPVVINLTQSAANSSPVGTISLTPVDFAKTVFNSNQTLFYLGAKNIISDPNLLQYAISRVSLGLASTTNAEVTIATLTGITPAKLSDDTTNLLSGAQIPNMALFNPSYIVVNAPTSSTPSTDNQIYMIINPDSAGNIVWPSNTINDANQIPTKEIKAIASSLTYSSTYSSPYIFTAVSATGLTWADNSDTGTDRGIAVVYPDFEAKKLTTLDASNITVKTAAAKAARLNVVASMDTTAALIAFRKTGSGITKAYFNPETPAKAGVDMIWSNDLKRLFIGITDVTREASNKEGGVISMVVGRLETDASSNKTALVFSPIINNPVSTFPVNETNHILGFYYDSNKTDASKISTKKVRLMLTSTNKYYLITNSNFIEKVTNSGGTATVKGYDGVFAFPLNTTTKDPALFGTLNGLPNVANPSVTVGTNAIEPTIEDSEATTDIFVHGDSVYLCLGSNSDSKSLGIFQSTALFDANGSIIGWTPWQRVMGSIQKVFGGAVDPNSNDFYFLASKTPSITDQTSNTVRVTTWGTTNKVNGNPNGTESTTYNLSSVLAQIFPQSQGGILQIIDFDTQTDGFLKNIFSMMIVIGRSKVALVQTGEWYSGVLHPITNFVEGENFIVFNDTSLQNIAPLCYAEVSRTTNSDSGYIFVGGLGGIAVLNKNNKGWASQTGLTSVSDLTGFKFTQLTASKGDFKNIRKLACRDNKLWVATKDNICTIDFSSSTFINTANETQINPNLPDGTKFSDFVVVPGNNSVPYLILATTNGLYSFKIGDKSAYLVGPITDPAVHLNFISMDKSNTSAQGNLYVLYANFVDEIGKVYRYYVNGINATSQSLVQQIKSTNSPDGLFVDLHYYRGNFVTDGSFGYSLLAKGLGQWDLFHMYEITTNPTDQNSNLTLDIGIDPEKNWYIGTVTKNSTSGSILVPGDWGLIVNE